MRGRRNTPLWFLRVPGLILGMCALAALAAEPPAAPASGAGTLKELDLAYREAEHGLRYEHLSPTLQNEAFSREPAIGKGKVYRGTFKFGADTNQAMAFIWDQGEGKLYLDLNRNRNLTDDAGGTHTCAYGRGGSRSHNFTNVQLAFRTPQGMARIVGDLNLHSYSQTPQGYIYLRSFWDGKVELANRTWQVALVESLSDRGQGAGGASLVLRPWEERGEQLRFDGGGSDSLTIPARLSVGGETYDVKALRVSDGANSKFRVEMKPVAVKLGLVEVSGSLVQRLFLTGNEGVVIADAPQGPLKAPVGSYNVSRVLLKKGETLAFREVDRAHGPGAVRVEEGKVARLTAGGPLTNSVQVTRRGKHLVLNYRLVGADGATYQMAKQDRSKPPEFAVYRRGLEIASGKFEYG